MKQSSSNVLLIEDDEDDYLLIQDYVRDFPCCNIILDWVDQYDDALERIQRSPPDLLLVDYNLNHINTGVDLVREVKKSGKNIPAILVTGQEMNDIGGDELFDVIDQYMNKKFLTGSWLVATLCAILCGVKTL